MNFSKEWDEIYSEGAQMNLWPWSDIVSHVMRYARPKKDKFCVLELGCGAGANIPFFQYLKTDYHAIEGSQSVVSFLHKKYPHLKDKIIAADFTKELPFPGQFDLVIERASITHNDTAAIKNCLRMIHDKLKIGGKYIGITWFSTKHSDYKLGRQAGDKYTRTDIKEGTFAGCGRVHFSDKKHLLELFSAFSIELMEHKFSKQVMPANDHVAAGWNIVAKKE